MEIEALQKAKTLPNANIEELDKEIKIKEEAVINLTNEIKELTEDLLQKGRDTLTSTAQVEFNVVSIKEYSEMKLSDRQDFCEKFIKYIHQQSGADYKTIRSMLGRCYALAMKYVNFG
jgi:archaellum component FlaC